VVVWVEWRVCGCRRRVRLRLDLDVVEGGGTRGSL
jgi:hypothetical protein